MRLFALLSNHLFVMLVLATHLCQHLSHERQQFVERTKAYRPVRSDMFHTALATPGFKIRFGLKLDDKSPFVFPLICHGLIIRCAWPRSHKITVKFL